MAKQYYRFGAGDIFVQMDGSTQKHRIKTIQDMELTFDGDIQELRGQDLFADDAALAKIDIGGKVTFGAHNLELFNAIFYGGTLSTSSGVVAVSDAAPVAIATTVTISDSFSEDLGVEWASGANAGSSLTRVASAPAAGQYSESAGVYTFSAADVSGGLTIRISYLKTTTTGQMTSFANRKAGAIGKFKFTYVGTYNNMAATVILNRCATGKLNPFKDKQGSHSLVEMEFKAMKDAMGSVGKISFADV